MSTAPNRTSLCLWSARSTYQPHASDERVKGGCPSPNTSGDCIRLDATSCQLGAGALRYCQVNSGGNTGKPAINCTISANEGAGIQHSSRIALSHAWREEVRRSEGKSKNRTPTITEPTSAPVLNYLEENVHYTQGSVRAVASVVVAGFSRLPQLHLETHPQLVPQPVAKSH